MNDLALKIENVTKEYRLGAIGGTTFREEMNRFIEKTKKKFSGKTEDSSRPERFMALNGVSFEVKKGERIGIIGRNGAGKSTLLKLLSRVTGPTSGTIKYNGKISSMLEVGTGFHGELTGRENIYMNGAILGMSKKEIDGKIEQIIEFAEMRQFIDTPVKRYSSGMYVKLAFAVAAHLDNDILIMDEVLAVGDMKFQKKCLGKMDDASKQDGKTVLFVSHNMNLIRQLCSRCIVLDKGTVIFDGDVEKAISIYFGNDSGILKQCIDLSKTPGKEKNPNSPINFVSAEIMHPGGVLQAEDDYMKLRLNINVKTPIDNIYFFCVLQTNEGFPLGFVNSSPMNFCVAGNMEMFTRIPLKMLMSGKFQIRLVLYRGTIQRQADMLDWTEPVVKFEKLDNPMAFSTQFIRSSHGNYYLGPAEIHFSDEISQGDINEEIYK